MKLCNLIPLGVKSHLKGRRTLLIAPKQGFWAKKSKISNVNISGVYEAICMKFCSLIPLITNNPLEVESEENFVLHLKRGHGLGRLKFININIYGVYEFICMKLCNLIPQGVKNHLEGRRTLLIAPKKKFGLRSPKLVMSISLVLRKRFA